MIILLYLLEKYVEIGVCVLRLNRSYFCDHTQRVQIDGIMSDFASSGTNEILFVFASTWCDT